MTRINAPRRSSRTEGGGSGGSARKGKWGMPSCSTIMICIFPLWIGLSFFELYTLLRPEPCRHHPRCLHPLFQSGQLIDIHVYASTQPQFPLGPLHKSKKIAIWNATGISPAKSGAISAKVQVAIPKGVRSEGSLYAHFAVVRHGGDPDPSMHLSSDARGGYGVHPYQDLVLASSPLTRLMKPMARNQSMLVGRAGGSADAGPGTALKSTSFFRIETKDIGQIVCGLILAFTLMGLLRPSGPLACVRAASVLGAVGLIAMAVMNAREASMVERASKLAAMAVAGDSSIVPVTHWKPRLRLRFVVDDNLYPDDKLPVSHIGWHEPTQTMQPQQYSVHTSGSSVRYAPRVFVDDFSVQMKHWIPLSTDKSRPDPVVEIQFQATGLVSFQVMKILEDSFKTLKGFGLGERDVDDVKEMLSDVSLKVLGITYLITFLHILFDYLAFKNDVGFFRGRENYEGLSSRSYITNAACSVIILLYLMDNDYTSRVILASQSISMIIEVWKAKRVSKAQIFWRYFLPWVSTAQGRSAEEGGAMTAGEKATNEIDAVGMMWLSRLLYPMVAIWAVYSLMTNPHKGWWSWLISSLANGVYTFGFIAMTPQLFVNYKLKSVAHLPWKPFMYKAFNTFIDDVFSWIMSMPTSHRIACLRDDVVFLVYLYQRYLYPVDKSRPNEFGMVYEETEADGEQEATHQGKKDK